MGRIAPLLILLLTALQPAAKASPEAAPPVFVMESLGKQAPLELRVLTRRELPPWRDMAIDRFGDLLILGAEGDLYTLSRDDSLVIKPFSGDLTGGIWPEALAADGVEWLLLVSQGRAILRLGRRGEALALTELPEQDTFWRSLKVDRSGRIWLAEESGGKVALLSRGGQGLQVWDLELRIPGYRGPLRAWRPDEQGGLYLAEAWPLVFHHLNAAGNLLATWQPTLPEGEPVLGLDSDDRLLLSLAPEGSERHLFHRKLWDEIYLAAEGTLWILERPGKGP